MVYPLSTRVFTFTLAVGHLCLMGTAAGHSAELVFNSTQDAFSFLVLGDWGMGSDVQKSVAKAMNHRAKKARDAIFVLNVGDNFYKDTLSESGEKQGGVDGLEDPLWRNYFENMYNHPHLERLPFVS
eukprot:9467729-Pyramimonas_sp.AAC.1